MVVATCEVVVAESLFFVGKFSIENELKMTDFKNKIHKKAMCYYDTYVYALPI